MRSLCSRSHEPLEREEVRMNLSDLLSDSVLRTISNATGGLLAGAALTMLVLAIPIAVSLFASYRLGWSQSVSSQSARFDLSLIALPLLAVGLWVWSLSSIKTHQIADIGLIASLPLLFFAALMVLSISFGFLMLLNPASSWLWVLHVGLLVLILHGTLPILYEVPRFPWTYKHIGVTSYIQLHQSINPRIDAYHNWPGFFALSALWTEALGFKSALEFAKWGQLFFNFLFIGPLLLLFGALSRSRQAIWVAVWFFFLTSWVSQDYFAPQALNFYLFLIVAGVSLNWLGHNPQVRLRKARATAISTVSGESVSGESVSGQPISSESTLDQPVTAQPERQPNPYFALMRQAIVSDQAGLETTPAQRCGLVGLLVLAFAVIVSSHQLTPFMLLAGLTALALWRRSRYPWLLVLLGVFVVLWGVTFAKGYTSGQSEWYATLGQFLQNLSANTTETLEESTGRVTASLLIKVFVLCVWGLAALGGIQQMRRGVVPLRAMLLAVAPFPLILLNSYGGEMLLRIYFFSLPFMSILITGGLPLHNPVIESADQTVITDTSVPALDISRPVVVIRRPVNSWRIVPITAVLSLGLVIGFLSTYTAKEKFYRVPAEEVSVLSEMYQKAPPKSMFILLNDLSLPLRITGNYEQFDHLPWIDTSTERDLELDQGSLDDMFDELLNRKRPMAYLILSASQRDFFAENNILRPGSYDRFRAVLARSKTWSLAWHRGDTEVYSIRNPDFPRVTPQNPAQNAPTQNPTQNAPAQQPRNPQPQQPERNLVGLK
jgi:hypothetical protein